MNHTVNPSDVVLNIRRFDMKSINFDKNQNKGPVTVLLGRRDTGKTVLVRDLLYHHQDIPHGTVISGTEEGNGFFSQMCPKIFLHNEYNTSIIENALRRQKSAMIEHNHACKVAAAASRAPPSSSDPRTFIILDDCLYDDKWARDKIMRLLFMNGRHWKIMLLITMQYPLGVPPMLRTNIDYAFILRDNIKSNRRRIYENYAGMFDTFEVFCQVMDQCTEDFHCLVIFQNAKSNKLCDQVFWYKADVNTPSFIMGDRRYWEISKNMNDSNTLGYNHREYDGSLTRKSNHLGIAVNKKN